MAIDLVVNTNARRLASGSGFRQSLVDAAKLGGARVYETRTLGELEAVASQIAVHGSQGVILAGGDGSHMAGVSALSRSFRGGLPPIALVPGGTVGTVARNVGMRGSGRSWA